VPKVHKVRKSSAGKEYICVKCRKPIVAGQEYFHWTKYRSATQQQHVDCGYPRRSQLSNSKMGPLWDEVDAFTPDGHESADDLQSALADIANVANDVAAEYSEAADNIESASGSGALTSEACRTVAEELESWASDLENWEPTADTEEGAKPVDDWLQEVREEASELVGNCPEYQG